MKNKFARPASLLLVLALAIATAAVTDARMSLAADPAKFPAVVVISTDDGVKEQITYCTTLLAAIDEAGIAIGDNDRLSLPDSTQLEPGGRYEVSVTRLDQVSLTWSGYALSAAGDFSNLDDLLSRSGFGEIDLSTGGRLENSAETAGDSSEFSLNYVDVDVRTVRKYEEIPFSTITVDDDTLYEGTKVVSVEGQNGTRALIYEETYENGVFISSEQVGTEIVKEPVQQVIHKGILPRVTYTKIDRATLTSSVQASLNKIKGYLVPQGNQTYSSFSDNGDGTITVDGVVFNYTSYKKRTITMYDGLECCLQKGCHSPAINHNTFSGVSAQRGLVAVYGVKSNGKIIGSVLPMGTIIFVEGYGLGVVADINGSKMNPDLVDVCFDAGEIRAGTATIGKWSRNVYILSVP